jgi:hypothetical protein
MADLQLVCEHCGARFNWTEKEQKDWPNDLNNHGYDRQPHCKSCRPKQDGQRS